MFELDAYSPRQIAEKVETIGVTKTRLPVLAVFMLAVLAGGFIGLGALYYVVVAADPALSFGTARVLGGAVFSLGLILVVVAGAELFTGNNLMVMAWAGRRISTAELARNWAIVYLGNAVGAMGLALVVYLANPTTGITGLYRDLLLQLGVEPPFSKPRLVARIRSALDDLNSTASRPRHRPRRSASPRPAHVRTVALVVQRQDGQSVSRLDALNGSVPHRGPRRTPPIVSFLHAEDAAVETRARRLAGLANAW